MFYFYLLYRYILICWYWDKLQGKSNSKTNSSPGDLCSSGSQDSYNIGRFSHFRVSSLLSHLHPALWPDWQVCGLQIRHVLWEFQQLLLPPCWPPPHPQASSLARYMSTIKRPSSPPHKEFLVPWGCFLPGVPSAILSSELRTLSITVDIYLYLPMRLEIVTSPCQDPANLDTERASVNKLM